MSGGCTVPLRSSPGAISRWKVQNGTAEQNVQLQIADALSRASRNPGGSVGSIAWFHFAVCPLRLSIRDAGAHLQAGGTEEDNSVEGGPPGVGQTYDPVCLSIAEDSVRE